MMEYHEINEAEAIFERFVIQKQKEFQDAPGKILQERIFDSATTFHIGAIRCVESVDLGEGRQQSPMIAAIVNFAFACELYIKALNLPGDKIKNHRLNILFSRLDPELRKRIADEYDRITGRIPIQLDADILTMANAFADWRYVFEFDKSTAINVGRLMSLARSLYAVSKENPNLKLDDATVATIEKELSEQVVGLVQFSTGHCVRALLRK